MTINYFSGCQITGVSSDTKPNFAALVGWRFIEEDTGNIYFHNGSTWVLLVGATKTETVTNKTVNATNNTITDTSAVLGDLLKHNGTRFVRLGMGSANQVLSVNAGGTDLTWATGGGGGGGAGFAATGTSTQSGNGSTTAFNIAHGQGQIPDFAVAIPTSLDANSSTYQIDKTSTNITVTYNTAPPSGTNNLIWDWGVAYVNQAVVFTPSSTTTLTNKELDTTLNTVKNVNPVITFYVWIDGSTYRALNTKTGIATSNSAFTTLIQSLIDGISPAGTPTVIELGQGDFVKTTTTPITINSADVGNITIRGQGRGLTNIVVSNAISDASDIISITGAVTGSDLPLTVNGTQGASSVTMTSGNAGTLAVNDFVLVRSTKNWSTHADAVGKQAEIKRVKSSVSTTVTFTSALYDTYTTTDTANVKKLVMLSNITIADLTIKPQSGYAGTGIMLYCKFVDNLQLNNVELKNTVGQFSRAIRIDSCTNSFLNNPYLVQDPSQTYNDQYGIGLVSANENITINSPTVRGKWRHGLVAANGIAGTDAEGICRNIKVNDGMADGGSVTPWDTHLEGDGIIFSNCSVMGGDTLSTDNIAGFSIRTKRTIINNPLVVNTQKYGIQIFSDAQGVQVVGGKIAQVKRTPSAAAGYGIVIDLNCADCTINGVEIESCGGSAIRMEGGAHRTKIKNCTLRNNGVETTGYGIDTSTTAITDSEVISNHITGNDAAFNLNTINHTNWNIQSNKCDGNSLKSVIIAPTSTIVRDNKGLAGFDFVVPIHRSGYKYGAHGITTSTGGVGLLTGYVTSGIGTHVGTNMNNNNGIFATWTTGTASGDQSGFRTTNNLTRRARNPVLYANFSIDNATSTRLFIGFNSTPTSFVSGADPLNAKSGIALVIDGGNFKVAHNDGTGATVFDDFSPVRSANTSSYRLKIVGDDSAANFYVEIDDGGSVYTATVSTDIPAQSTTMGGSCIIENATTSSRVLTLVLWEGFF